MGDKMIEQEETLKVLGVLIVQDERYKEYLVNGKNSMMKFLNTRHSMVKMLSNFADHHGHNHAAFSQDKLVKRGGECG